jgi:hypothetical protein
VTAQPAEGPLLGSQHRRGRTGCGRSKGLRASTGTSPTGYWPLVSGSLMCRRSCRRGHGSPPGRAVRLTPPTLIQWRWRVPTCVRLRPVVNNEQLAPLSGPGRPAPVARRGPHLHGRPVAPAAARAHPGRSEEESVRRQAMTLLATVRPRDAVGKARCRVAAGLIADLERDLPAIQGGRQGAQATGCRDREQADGVARHRTVRRSAAARGGR